jgi:hypothetical protein
MPCSDCGKFATDVVTVLTMPQKHKLNWIRLNAKFNAFTNFAKECFFRTAPPYSTCLWNSTYRKPKNSNAHGLPTIKSSLLTAHSLLQKKLDYRSNSCRKFPPSATKPYLKLLRGTQQKYADSMSRALLHTLSPKISYGQPRQNPRLRKKQTLQHSNNVQFLQSSWGVNIPSTKYQQKYGIIINIPTTPANTLPHSQLYNLPQPSGLTADFWRYEVAPDFSFLFFSFS